MSSFPSNNLVVLVVRFPMAPEAVPVQQLGIKYFKIQYLQFLLTQNTSQDFFPAPSFFFSGNTFENIIN